jgi:hypothetical protein
MKQPALAAGWTLDQIDRALLDLDQLPPEFNLTAADVRNIVAANGGDGTRLDPEDVISFEAHLARDPGNTYVYRQQVMEGEVQKVPLVCGFVTPALLASLLEYGDGRAVAIDSTFGTNRYMVRT